MYIRKIEAIYPNYGQPLSNWRKHLWQIVVRIESDDGRVGYGFGGGGEAALPIVNGHFRDLLTNEVIEGRTDIERIWEKLYRASIPYGRRGAAIMALSGVDLALWDLLGKSSGVPVYQLLADRRPEPISAYATGRDPAWFVDLGFEAIKIPHRWSEEPSGYETAEASAQQAREALGPGGKLMFDCYMSWDGPTAIEMAQRLAPYEIFWFEDLLTPDQRQEQADLRPHLAPIRLAGGEHEFTRHGFAEIARTDALDIWQPDITWCGGLTAGIHIGEMARAAGCAIVPHRGGEVWGLHLIAAGLCDGPAELVLGGRSAQLDQVWLDQPQAEGGFILPSDAPGFGVRPNPALVAEEDFS